MEVKELGHVVFYVSNLARSRGFYGGILGWKEVGSGSNVAAFSSGRTHHELLLIEVGPEPEQQRHRHRVGFCHVGLKVGESDEELREAIRKVTEAGVPIVGMSDHMVTHSLYILDPDGNEVELFIDVQPPVWKQNPKAVLAPTRPLRL